MAAEKQSSAPFLEQIRSFGRVYWIANWMELIERFAYYGVRTVLPVFMVLAISEGGPEFSHTEKGVIYAIWALVQSFVPIFTGGFADRYGYKLNIAIATVLKIIGYLLMGYCIQIAVSLAGMPLEEARAADTDLAYETFFAGAMFLALGTAIFKPGLQGLIANQMPRESSSLGWGLFYQMVNIGGFLGPMVAGYLRVLEWEYVFVACSVGIALNFVPLFWFKEPERPEGLNRETPLRLLIDAVHGLLEPRLFFFTISFAGFWLMFYQLFDILPNFIDDWVDSRGAAGAIASVIGDGAVPIVNGGNLTQEWIINVNALLISLLAFAVGYVTGRIRSLTAIVIGIGISAAGIYALGLSMSGWWILGAIALFSLGEMAASPTKMRYLASIAPKGKDGLYMGYVNMTVGIGWSIGSIVAGEMYQEGGDKVVLAERYLREEAGIGADVLAQTGRGGMMELFEQTMHVDAWGARELLWQTYEPYGMWIVFTLIGLGSMIMIVLYDRLTRAADADPQHTFNTHGHLWVRIALIPIVGALTLACFLQYSGAVLVQAVMFGLLFIASFFPPEEITPSADEPPADEPPAEAP
ncbi:MAG: MFS transporter [Myxococcales bacterium]|nr:MFS transporter [Myxococcales bacterium]